MDLAIFYRKSEINFRLFVRQAQEEIERNGGIRTECCNLEYAMKK